MLIVVCLAAVLFVTPALVPVTIASGSTAGLSLIGVESAADGGTQLSVGGAVPSLAPQPSTRPTNPLEAALDHFLGFSDGSFVSTSGGGTGYVVGHDDPLWRVSSSALGDPYAWRVIFDANQGVVTNPNRVPAGTILSTPDPGRMSLDRLVAGADVPAAPRATTAPTAGPTSSPQVVTGLIPRTTTGSLPWGTHDWVNQTPPRSTATTQQQAPSPQQQTAAGRFNAVLPMKTGRITSDFGPRSFQGEADDHQGIDIAAPRGTPVYVTGDGVVTFAGWQGGYGRLVIVRHADGTETYYAHCREATVSVGEQVAAGQQIATVNNTGRSTGDHLHFEIRRNGRAVDPRQFFTFPAVGRNL